MSPRKSPTEPAAGLLAIFDALVFLVCVPMAFSIKLPLEFVFYVF
jgi:hypothetical protein